jgi:uncharacterized membrane protein
MGKGRLEAFSDGVIAILITIMVLELKVPHEHTFEALREPAPVFGTYLMSFIYIGIYWNNHHHMFHMTDRINGAVLWANLHLLFWLSLISFTTGWMGENCFAPVPTAAYGFNLFMCGVAYLFVQNAIIADQGPGSKLQAAVGHDVKGKASALLYLVAIGLAFVFHWVSLAIYIGVALMWLVPDPRIEKAMESGTD